MSDSSSPVAPIASALSPDRMDSFLLLELLGAETPLQERARNLLRWTQTALESAACGLILLQGNPDASFEGFVLTHETSNASQSSGEHEISAHEQERELSALLEYVDRLLAEELGSERQANCSGFFCAGRVLKANGRAHSAMIFSQPERQWSASELSVIESVGKALEREMEREALADSERVKSLWMRHFEVIQQSRAPCSEKADLTLKLAKELLRMQAALVWSADSELVSCLICESESPRGALSAPHPFAGSLAALSKEEPLHFHTPKIRQQLGSLSRDLSAPSSAILIPFSSSKKSHYLLFSSDQERASSIAPEDLWIAKQCANWLGEALEALQTEELLALARADSADGAGAMEASADGIITVDTLGRVLRYNAAAGRMAGLGPEALGRALADSITLSDSTLGVPIDLRAASWQSLPAGEAPWGRYAALCAPDGARVDVECRVAPIRGANGEMAGAALSLHDVTQARLMERQMIYTRDFDRLTGLLNRDSLFELLGNALASARFGHEHCLIYLDIDHLKTINDTHGHSAGDMLLKEAAAFFKAELGERAAVSRFGADEFVILIEYCSLEMGVELAASLREKLSRLIFQWEGQRFPITASMGLTLIDKNRQAPEEIIADADAACFGAKLKGRNQVKVSHQEDLDEIQNRRKEMEWALQLNQALDESRLSLCFQPIVHTFGDTELAVSEALMRLRLPNGSEVSPGAFMDIAERYNIAPKLDRWVAHKLLSNPQRSLAAVQAQQPGALRAQININLSGASINDPSFLAFLKEEAAHLGALAQCFCFEVTETAAVKSLSSAAVFLRELKSLGFLIALDDFGAGMSSFSYLKHFPIDIVKIDGSIVKNSPEHFVDRVIMSSIASACAQLGLKVVAENVETEAVFNEVKKAGIAWSQGYHLRRPESISISFD